MNGSGQAVYIGLGSNLDDPPQQLRRAILQLRRLPQSQFIALSNLYLSKPVGPQGQPDFLNAVALIHTRLKPIALLDQLQAIEHMQLRKRGQHWGPRTLDLDILLFDALTLDSPRLVIPHPHLQERGFVLFPLLDITPGLLLPDGKKVADLAAKLDPSELEKYANADDFLASVAP